jgi:uncharacterized protein (TIRG00374 family)
MLSFKKTISAVLSLGLGIFLVWLVLNQTEVSGEQVLDKLQHLNLFLVCLIIISTFTHLWLSAYKWRIITQKLSKNDRQSQNFYLGYTILAALAIQFLPQHIGQPFVQSLAIKMHKVTSLSRGLFSVIYDQLLNILVPIFLLPPALFYILGKISLSWAIFITLGILLGIHYAVARWNKPLILFLGKSYWKLKQLSSRKQQSSNQEQVIEDIPVLSTRFTLHLFWLSTFRHLNWILRSFFIVMAGGFAIKFWSIFFTTTLVQSAMLLSFTPANLGLMEWSWIGGLTLLGVLSGEAGNFALLQRILGLGSVIAIAIAFYLGVFANTLFRKSNKLSVRSNKN